MLLWSSLKILARVRAINLSVSLSNSALITMAGASERRWSVAYMSLELVCSLCHGTQPWQEDALGYINQELTWMCPDVGCWNPAVSVGICSLMLHWACSHRNENACVWHAPVLGWLIKIDFSQPFFLTHLFMGIIFHYLKSFWSFVPQHIWICLYNLHKAVSFWTCDKKLIGLQFFSQLAPAAGFLPILKSLKISFQFYSEGK